MKKKDLGQTWGIPIEAVEKLGERLHGFYERYRHCFKTKTRNDANQYGYHYMSGLLRVKTERNYTGIANEQKITPQNMQHFMSNSPWSSTAVYQQVQNELKDKKEITDGGVIILDESPNEKAGTNSAGAAKQYNGRMGKIEISQVGVFLCYANMNLPQGFWTWINGKLYLPKSWFEQNEENEKRRNKLKIPADLIFKTKIELAWDMIENAIENYLPFETIHFDSLYGRSEWLRKKTRDFNKIYMAEVPANTKVFLEKLELTVPTTGKNKNSSVRIKKSKIHNNSFRVDKLHEKLEWETILVRITERGELKDKFGFRRVWTVEQNEIVPHWLVVRKENGNKFSYALCNAPEDTSKQKLAWWKCQRYFIERANQDAKSELGWDEFQAQKYQSFNHHLALVVLASWFVAQTKLEWAQDYPRDPELMKDIGTDALPGLSMANIRELLRSVMPLKNLTPQQATELIVERLMGRARSRKSRLKNHDVDKTGM